MTQPPDKIIYCYSVMQNKLEKLAAENPKVELHEGFNSDLYLDHDPSMHSFLIIDDLMGQDIYCELSDLFTKYSRHHNISVAFLTQVKTSIKSNSNFFVLKKLLMQHIFFLYRMFITNQRHLQQNAIEQFLSIQPKWCFLGNFF